MKKLSTKLFILIILAVSLSMFVVPRKIKTKPLTIYVYDAKSKAPLKGIVVTSIVKAKKTTNLLIDSFSDTKYFFFQYISDENGCVSIPARKCKVAFRYVFSCEEIYANIVSTKSETNNDFKAVAYEEAFLGDGHSLKRPVKQYEGVSLRFFERGSRFEELSDEYKQPEDTAMGLTQNLVYPETYEIIFYLRNFKLIK